MKLSFTIPVQIKWEIEAADWTVPQLDDTQIRDIENSLSKNGRTYEDACLSDVHGKVWLLSKKMRAIDSRTLHIDLEFDCENCRDAIQPDEIIYAIMPACYSVDPDAAYFYGNDDDVAYYGYLENRRVLDILDTPTILTI